MTDTTRWVVAGLVLATATAFTIYNEIVAKPAKWDRDLWDWVHLFHGTREDFEKHRGPRP